MRFTPHLPACVLLAAVAVCSTSNGQTSTRALSLIQTERGTAPAYCSASPPAAAEFSPWATPAEREMGLKGWLDGLSRGPGKIRPWRGSFEEVRCPRGCQVCGIVYDKDTAIRFCTKG
jgi:hypothetical protein